MTAKTQRSHGMLALLRWLGVAVLFIAVHLYYWYLASTNPGVGFGDVGLYMHWAADALDNNYWPLRDFVWVYPALALIPIILPGFASTTDWHLYIAAWCALVAALNALAIVILMRRTWWAAIWWLLFLAFLGPVAFGRIDAIAVPFAIAGLLFGATRPRVAAALLTVGAWVKVAPGALVLSLLVIIRRPLTTVVLPAALVSMVVGALVLAGGGLGNITSFVSAQGERGLQLESVAASGWIIDWMLSGNSQPAYNHELFTWEIDGPGTQLTTQILGFLLPVAVIGITWLTWLARRSLPTEQLLVWSGLALTLALIIFNKVGSPQFVSWIAAPVAVGLAQWVQANHSRILGQHRGQSSSRLPSESATAGPANTAAQRGWPAWLDWSYLALWALVIALLTQLIFPIGYFDLISGSAGMLWALVLRNGMLLALFAVAILRLWPRADQLRRQR